MKRQNYLNSCILIVAVTYNIIMSKWQKRNYNSMIEISSHPSSEKCSYQLVHKWESIYI